MKTSLFLLLLLSCLALTSVAQYSNNSLNLNDSPLSSHPDSKNIVLPGNFKRPLLPVYFSYNKRKLILNGKRMSGIALVNMCRSINDPCVQEQLKCYDQLSTNKRWILTSTAFCGANTFVMICATSSTTQNNSAIWASCALASAIAAGVTAICSSIPHQKRKIIMFHDLPIAYNNYLASQTNK